MTLSPWGDGVEESWCPSDKVNCPLVLALLWSSAAPVRNNITHIRWQHVHSAPSYCVPFLCCLFLFFFLQCTDYFQLSGTNRHRRQPEPLHWIGLTLFHLSFKTIRAPWIIVGSAKRCRQRKERKQKWRSRAGYQVQLWKQHYKPRFCPSTPTPDPLQTKQLQSEIYYNRVVYRL